LRVLVATGNPDKLREVSEIIAFPGLEITSLNDLGVKGPDEIGLTLRENAWIKAGHGFRASGIPTVAEDTGLFVDALGGMPGVFSSRFAGPGATYGDNRQKLLSLLAGVPFEKRRAWFTTVACITTDGEDFTFVEGRVEGFITRGKQGEGIFGYDPVFLYPPMGRTFAELPPDVKNAISHRGKALRMAREILLKIS
jgi:XTP/dITP diphosphohydrolase